MSNHAIATAPGQDTLYVDESAEFKAQRVVDEVQHIESITDYRKQRKAEYDMRLPLGDQLDAILKQIAVLSEQASVPLDLDFATIIATQQDIKARYPK